MNKKTIIILFVSVAVAAAVYFLFFKKKEEEKINSNNASAGTDGETKTVASNFNTSYAAADDAVRRQLEEETALKAYETVKGNYKSTLTAADQTKYSELRTKYATLTGKTDGENYDLNTLKTLVAIAEENALKAREIETRFPEFLKAGAIETKNYNFNSVAKLVVLEEALEQFKNRAEKAAKALYEDIKGGTKWYYSKNKKAYYFHKDIADAWNADNMQELLQIPIDAEKTGVTSNPKNFAENVKKEVNRVFMLQPKTTFDVLPAKATDEQVSNGRYRGNSGKKTFTINGQSISNTLGNLPDQWFNAREKQSGVNYGEKVKQLYAGL